MPPPRRPQPVRRPSLFPAFLSQFNPKDARFLGTPLDFIVFDGLDEGDVRRVVFVEVKTGKASLLSGERRCRDAIEAGRVEYQLLRLPADVFKAEAGAPSSSVPSGAALEAHYRAAAAQ